MTLTIAVFLLATVVWICIPMNAENSAALRKTPEYFLAIAMFGFGGVGILLDLVNWLPDNILFTLRFAPLLVGGICISLYNLSMGAFIRPAGLLLLAIYAPMLAFAFSEGAYVMPLMSLAIMAPAIIVPQNGYSTESLYAGLRDAVRLSLVMLAACIIFSPGQLIGPCRGDKCSVWGLAIGPLGTGNAFGLYLALVAGLSVLLSRNTFTAVLATLASLTLVDATSSRSALLAWVIGVSAAYVWRWAPAGRRIALIATGLVTAAFLVAMGTHTWRPEEFTGRANLWAVAKEQFSSSPIFGYGPSFWVRQDPTSYVEANYATHNLLWEMLISGGIIGATLLVLAVLSLLRSGHESLQGSTLVLVTALMGNSVLEVIAAPGRLYILPGALLLIFIHGQSRMLKSNPAEPSARPKAAFLN